MSDKAQLRLEQALGDLACEWRSVDRNSLESLNWKNKYLKVLDALLYLGISEALDPDCELPDEYMPKEYLKNVAKRNI